MPLAFFGEKKRLKSKKKDVIWVSHCVLPPAFKKNINIYIGKLLGTLRVP